ncbi:Dihydrolipoyllysine-residue acetyltransferase component of pyruvate dehydrogenase complex [Candidatus Clavichlamydia salmonicola]|uniref:dihydrolipoamide acetyltransferase family protein n=1 Tax=Candidatus Clavichlamydia salmonicola TaxID=469812 RepID=UPI001891594E|nr:dihydrolipoamide acetyltransferase family protein [Candidatus Clavichlamydia salmonicola]MBF5051242.1 Dihydrolipoyllysine-residue acetyltransferase component of pyruvate dehydrogenase complex [Candidatus Clavichlamydia salmonicola]
MITVIKVPKLSPTMTSGTVVKWHKNISDFIASGELIAEIATDKATVEYHAFDEGFLRHQFVKVNETMKIGDPFFILSETTNEDFSLEVFIKPQETITLSEKEILSPSAEKSIPTPSYVPVSFSPEPPLEKYSFPYSGTTSHASPAARYFAKQNNLDLYDLKGSGPGGRVILQDLKHAKPISLLKFGNKKLPTILPGTFVELPLSPMQKIIAERLQSSKTHIPHFYIKQTVNASPLTSLITQLKTASIKLSINDFIVKATALSLRDHPDMNAGFNAKNETLISFQTIDIAIAVAIPEGLITPIVRHADYKNVSDISIEIKTLAEKAKQGKLQPEEFKGGSFSISNLGMTGISEFSAIINPPQAAILAIGSIEDRPCIENGSIKIGKEMILTLSIDHRVVNGKAAALFLKTVQKYLENPALLLLN